MNRFILLAAASLLSTSAFAWSPTSSSQPTWTTALPWSLNNAGSGSITNDTQLLNILTASYVEWEAPTCSGFRHQYNGTTNRDSTNSNDGNTTHGFLDGWPQSYGDPYSVIGITLGVFTTGFSSEYIEADVNFNEAVYTFTVGQPTGWYSADLQSIATHEFGHSLGLGHTNSNGATMYPSYDNGTAGRSLGTDDTNGVCALYPGSGTGNGSTDPLPTDDQYEQNDDATQATPATCGQTIEAYAGDMDWYAVTVGTNGRLGGTLTWGATDADLDLYIFTANSQEPIDLSEGTNVTTESVTANNLAAGTYYLLVNPYQGQVDYRLVIDCGEGGTTTPTDPTTPGGDDIYEENDDGENLAPIKCGDVIDAFAGDEDWFGFETGAAGVIRATVAWGSEAAADLDLYLVDTIDVRDRSENEGGTSEVVDFDGAPAGLYAVVVTNFRGEDNYQLSLECTGLPDDGGENPGGCACDSRGGSAGFGGLLLMMGLAFRRRR